MKKWMVGYGRVSTDADRQLDSLENQRLFFSQFADSHGYELRRVYADEGISGRQLKNREEFMRMLRDARREEFDTVVVKDVSRFARNTVDLLTSVRELKGMGINVLFVNNDRQTLGESEFVLTLLGAVAQEESANLSRRVQFGKEVNARRGRVPVRVLGYDRLDNFTLIADQEEAEIVRYIFSRYLQGDVGMARLAAELDSRGLRTARGCRYSEGYIRRVLTNPLYCGELVNRKTRTVDYIQGRRISLPLEEQYRHPRPELAIVTREQFERVQAIRTGRRRAAQGEGGQPARRHTGRYLFSGLVRCAVCGSTMYRRNDRRPGGGVDSYWRCPSGAGLRGEPRCSNRRCVRDDLLLRELSRALGDCVGEPKAFLAQARGLGRPAGSSCPGQGVEESRARLMRQRERYTALFADGRITREELDTALHRIDGGLSCLEREAVGRGREPERRLEGILTGEGLKNGELRRFLECVQVGDGELRFIFRVDGDTLR